MVNVPAPGRTYAAHVHRLTAQVAALVAAFALGVGLAELFGAASLGVAFGFGQIAFGLGLAFVMLRAPS
jgi:hypothetical protein